MKASDPQGGSLENNIDRQLRKSGKQSDSLVLDLGRSNFDPAEVEAVVRKRMRTRGLRRVEIIRQDGSSITIE